jgi:AraC-like DNA-binding protein
MHYIRENYQKRLKVEEVAEAVGLSKEYLSSKFKQVAGIALPDYINQQKIGEAKQLLHFTDMSLSEISQYLSFSSQSYFQTVFKNLTGDTPMEYRIKNKYFA